jgi:hypothetical protein
MFVISSSSSKNNPMEKRIENVFDFENYRLLLGADYAKRSAINPSYSLRSYARDLEISLSYLSEVINNKKDLSVEKGHIIFSNMGLSGVELDFIESMIIINTSHDPAKQYQAREVFNELKSSTGFKFNSTKDEIINSVEHFLVFTFTREYTDIEDIYHVASMLQISNNKVDEVLNDFVEKKYISVLEDKYTVEDPDFMISDHENYCDFLTKLSGFFYNHYQKQNINSVKESSASNLILGLDDKTIKEVHDLNKHYIMTLLKISNRVKEPKYFGFVSNLYLQKNLYETK